MNGAYSRKLIQAKHIPEAPILAWLAARRPPRIWATWFAGYDNSVQNAMPPGTPEKVALAKMRSLIKRKLVDGCPCGCRGDFRLPEESP